MARDGQGPDHVEAVSGPKRIQRSKRPDPVFPCWVPIFRHDRRPFFFFSGPFGQMSAAAPLGSQFLLEVKCQTIAEGLR